MSRTLADRCEPYVYYPCAGYDGSAVKVFSKAATTFVYVDQRYTLARVDEEIDVHGFRGYDRAELSTDDERFAATLKTSGCICVRRFRRSEQGPRVDGAESFRVAFLVGDGVRTLAPVVETLGPPIAFVYIRPGISFGGNRKGFPPEMERAIVSMAHHHPADAVRWIAYDKDLQADNGADMPRVRRMFSRVVRRVRCSTTMVANTEIKVAQRPGSRRRTSP